jgi:excisionase family DNA binding protein
MSSGEYRVVRVAGFGDSASVVCAKGVDMDRSGRMFTVRELAKYLRVHTTTVYRLAKAGDLPGFRVGSDWRFRGEDLDRWLKQLQKRGRSRGPHGRA